MKKTRLMIAVMAFILALAVIASSCTSGRGGCYATKGMSGYGR